MGSSKNSDLIAQAQEWIDHDPDQETRSELLELLKANNTEELDDRFSRRLTFGTAGIRGTQGGGPNRMNRLTLRKVAVGISQYLRPESSVVIGYDARKNSEVFATDMSEVFSHYGIHSYIFTKVVPTPVLSFAVRQKSADMGIMITASHNPATDNGCKVFLADGAQLRSPMDDIIDRQIELSQLPPKEIIKGPGVIEEIGDKIWIEYCETVANTVKELSGSLAIAYTPLHGVSWETVEQVFRLKGITNLITVPSQVQPDSSFPSTPFPNPEEAGVLDGLFNVAQSSKADIALANDPDGDRLAIGVPQSNGEWRALSGNEIGALLCNRMLQVTSGQNRKVVSSIVSSSLIEKIAEEEGVEHAQTLTGFKWIISEAYRDPKMNTVFSFEEALGYAVCSSVRDKDGISAALRFVEMAEDLKKKNLTVIDQLNNLYLKHGLHVSRSQAIRVIEHGQLPQVDFPSELLRYGSPGILGSFKILEFGDYDQAAINAGLELPKSNMIRLILETGIRIFIRPSGTEPVVKAYLEKVVDVKNVDEIGNEQTRTGRAFDSILEDLKEYLRQILVPDQSTPN